jgi:hypothetical protein
LKLLNDKCNLENDIKVLNNNFNEMNFILREVLQQRDYEIKTSTNDFNMFKSQSEQLILENSS